ncbi:MAG: hypothetical protein H5U02_01750 [Clostridia bacterium]|nr:hypothetical protein [Clostridia bacterium]
MKKLLAVVLAGVLLLAGSAMVGFTWVYDPVTTEPVGTEPLPCPVLARNYLYQLDDTQTGGKELSATWRAMQLDESKTYDDSYIAEPGASHPTYTAVVGKSAARQKEDVCYSGFLGTILSTAGQLIGAIGVRVYDYCQGGTASRCRKP